MTPQPTYLMDAVVVRHAFLLLSTTLLAFLRPQWPLLSLVGPAAFAVLLWCRRAAWSERGLGWANRVTLLRLVLVAALGTLNCDQRTALAAVVLGVLVLDGLDGWLARRLAQSSDFGASLDMEVDAYLVAMTSFCLFRCGLAGAWILLPASLRYGWVLTVAVTGQPTERPRSRLSRSAFLILMLSFTAAFLPLGWGSTALCLLGTATVSVSFGVSFAELWLELRRG